MSAVPLASKSHGGHGVGLDADLIRIQCPMCWGCYAFLEHTEVRLAVKNRLVINPLSPKLVGNNERHSLPTKP